MITLFSDEEIWDMHLKSEKREAAKEAAREAAIETTIEDGKDYGVSREDIFMRLQRKFELSEKEAKEMLELYW